MYGLKYVPLETEFESSIFEFELLNLSNCIKKLNLNHIIWICIVESESLHWKTKSECYNFEIEFSSLENSTLYIFTFSSRNSNSAPEIQFQSNVTDIQVVEEEQTSADPLLPISTYVFACVIYFETEEVETGDH